MRGKKSLLNRLTVHCSGYISGSPKMEGTKIINMSKTDNNSWSTKQTKYPGPNYMIEYGLKLYLLIYLGKF